MRQELRPTDTSIIKGYLDEFIQSTVMQAILEGTYHQYKNPVTGKTVSKRSEIRRDLISSFDKILESLPKKRTKLESSPFRFELMKDKEKKLFHYQHFNRMFSPNQIHRNKNNDILFALMCVFTEIPVTYWVVVAESYRDYIKTEYVPLRVRKNTDNERGDQRSNNEIDEESMIYLSKLEGKQFIVYFNKTDNRFYRTFLKFTKVRPTERKVPLIGVEYCSEKASSEDKKSLKTRIDMTGTGFLNENKNLSIRLQTTKRSDQTQTLYLRGNFEFTDPNSNNESIIIGTRSIDNNAAIYTGLVVFRLLNQRLLESHFDDQNRISSEIKDVPDKSTEETIIHYLASFRSFKTSTFESFEKFETKKEELLVQNGRENFSKIYYPKLRDEVWVSLSRTVRNPDHVAISYWTFETNKLSREIIATRKSHRGTYKGEVSQCSRGRIWFKLTQSKSRKYIVGTYDEDDDVIKALTTSLHPRTQETIVTREIMLPAHRLPDDLYQKILQEKRPSPIRYEEDFLQNDKLSKEIKGFLSNRKSSVLSFPKLAVRVSNGVSIKTDYGRKIYSRDFEGDYFLYVRNCYKDDGSLFRCTLNVDQLGNAEFRKKKPYEKYDGEAQQFDKTLNIQFEHVPKKGKIAKQHIQLSIIISKGDKLPIMFGQIADVDVHGFPDCYSCFLIPLPEDLAPDGFKTKDVAKNSKEYEDLSAIYQRYFKDHNQSGYKPSYDSIESYFTKTGSVSF